MSLEGNTYRGRPNEKILDCLIKYICIENGLQNARHEDVDRYDDHNKAWAAIRILTRPTPSMVRTIPFITIPLL